jgi:hypothetical protein
MRHTICVARLLAAVVALGGAYILITRDATAQQTANCTPMMSDLQPPDPQTKKRALTPIDASTKTTLLNFGLPCTENVTTEGPAPTGLQNLQRGFDFYSWLTFIALNSPSDGSGIEKSKPNSRAKWEDGNDFKQLLNVMLEGGKEPEWKTNPLPAGCKRPDDNPNIMVVEMIEETFNQPFKTGPLIDQQGNYALFDIWMNKQMFDYIRDNKLYSRKEQEAKSKANFRIDFPAGHREKDGKPADVGAVMLKVSWKIIETEKDKERFHTVDALVSMQRTHDQKGDPPCLRKTLGLVGFHVAHKTERRLQWLWTSFEHVDNVPEQAEVDKGGPLKASYNFYKPGCDTTKCPVNQTPPRPWDPKHELGLKFHTKYASQITRVIAIFPPAKKMNEQFQALLAGTVWKNYMLLSTQWPSDFACAGKFAANSDPNLPQTADLDKQPDMSCAPAPTFLANTTLETYSQGRIPLASSTCMGCHANATSYQRPDPATTGIKFFNQTDFTFMLEKAR